MTAIHHPVTLVVTAASASATTASFLGALPTAITEISGTLTIVFMLMQIILAVRNWGVRQHPSEQAMETLTTPAPTVVVVQTPPVEPHA